MLNKDSFNLIAEHLDGQDAACCSRVCKAWKRYVELNETLMWKKKIHLIELSDIKDIEKTITPGNDELISISRSKANMWLQNIFWFRFGVNINAELALNHNDSFLHHLLGNIEIGYKEGANILFQGKHSKNLVIANNYYGSHARKCGMYDTAYECTPADHAVEHIEQINAFCPGVISNWKHVHFPFAAGPDHYVHGQCFYRGTSLMITVSSCGLQDAIPIHSNLVRMKKAMPKSKGFFGTGKNLRYVNHGDTYQNNSAKIFRKREYKTIVHSGEEAQLDRDTLDSIHTKHKKYKAQPYCKKTGCPSWKNGW